MKGGRKNADTVGNLAAPKDDGGTGIEPTSGAEARSSCPIYGTTEVVPFPISLLARARLTRACVRGWSAVERSVPSPTDFVLLGESSGDSD
jgi:hypothetical protein